MATGGKATHGMPQEHWNTVEVAQKFCGPGKRGSKIASSSWNGAKDFVVGRKRQRKGHHAVHPTVATISISLAYFSLLLLVECRDLVKPRCVKLLYIKKNAGIQRKVQPVASSLKIRRDTD
ncbi:hypothetical protein E2C01_018228 [Portunus trituberculatus]|uniref:Uncharacterized protein n=1 Tax=Portunus trituberculatus TaxID=210409 RepID=A0A5B7DVK2_PORTR|nr:hypothetical protein [Portunus trituberculatus]